MSRPPTEFVTGPEQIAWTPHGMTRAQALEELPAVCLLLMKTKPCAMTVIRLEHFEGAYFRGGRPELAALVARCTVTARQLVAVKEYAY
jgi:hypothetical protein